MKLLRYGPPGQEKPGMLDADGTIRDISSLVDDIAGDTLTPDAPGSPARTGPVGLAGVDPTPASAPASAASASSSASA